MAAGMARTLLGAMSQEQKDRLLVAAGDQNREKLLDKGNRAARDKRHRRRSCATWRCKKL
ncbi:MAG: hypothetical protein ACLSHM_01865 [Vescimonas sp.]